MKTEILRQLEEIVIRGQTTPEEAFRISFGDWPPAGLDTSNYCPIKADIKIIDNKTYLRNFHKGNLRSKLLSAWQNPGHYISYGEDSHIIAFNHRHILQDSGRVILGHESFHAAQHEVSSESGYWFSYFFSNPGAPKKCDFSESHEVMKAVFLADRSKIKKKKKPALPVWRIIAARLLIGVFGKNYFTSFGRYLKSGHEIQAYMHDLFSRNYATWQRIPEDKTTLWAALSQAGIATPEQVTDYLSACPAGMEAMKTFKPLNPPDRKKAAVVILNASYRKLKNDMGKRLFWQFGLPLLYGQLLEIYGDPEGRVKMGFTPKSQGLARNLADLNKYRSRKFRYPASARCAL